MVWSQHSLIPSRLQYPVPELQAVVACMLREKEAEQASAVQLLLETKREEQEAALALVAGLKQTEMEAAVEAAVAFARAAGPPEEDSGLCRKGCGRSFGLQSARAMHEMSCTGRPCPRPPASGQRDPV